MRAFLFAVLLLLAASPVSLPGASSGALATEAPAEERSALQALLPKEGEIPGLQERSGEEFYVSQNLFDYMNGQAEMYLHYGFSLLLSKEYAAGDGQSLTLELYRMASPLHAFGIYAAERTPEDLDSKVGAEGYLGNGVLGFWKGSCYVKVICARMTPAAKELLEEVGHQVAGKIRGTDSAPQIFRVFPEEGRVKRSERFIPKNFMGQAYLRNGYRVEYQKAGKSYQMFLLQEGSQEDARSSLQRYQAFLQSQQEKVSSTNRSTHLLVFAEGEKNKTMFQCGHFWGGVVNGGNGPETERIIQGVVDRLKATNP